MSINTIERVLWEAITFPDKAEVFRSQPEEHFNSYFHLTSQEKQLLHEMDVRKMADLGASEMLLMLAWQVVRGPETMNEYMGRMNTPSS